MSKENALIAQSLHPMPYTASFGIGWSRRRLFLKFTASTSGLNYKYLINNDQYTKRITFGTSNEIVFLSLGYRFAEPKKLGLFREKTTKRSKDKIKEIISPVD